MVATFLCTAILVLALTLLIKPTESIPPNRVRVDGRFGSVLGIVLSVDDQRVNAFNGVPFAEPPVGALRFASPVARSRDKAPRDALLPGHSCVQHQHAAGKLYPPRTFREHASDVKGVQAQAFSWDQSRPRVRLVRLTFGSLS